MLNSPKMCELFYAFSLKKPKTKVAILHTYLRKLHPFHNCKLQRINAEICEQWEMIEWTMKSSRNLWSIDPLKMCLVALCQTFAAIFSIFFAQSESIHHRAPLNISLCQPFLRGITNYNQSIQAMDILEFLNGVRWQSVMKFKSRGVGKLCEIAI